MSHSEDSDELRERTEAGTLTATCVEAALGTAQFPPPNGLSTPWFCGLRPPPPPRENAGVSAVPIKLATRVNPAGAGCLGVERCDATLSRATVLLHGSVSLEIGVK